jgi:hypothetical protein
MGGSAGVVVGEEDEEDDHAADTAQAVTHVVELLMVQA